MVAFRFPFLVHSHLPSHTEVSQHLLQNQTRTYIFFLTGAQHVANALNILQGMALVPLAHGEYLGAVAVRCHVFQAGYLTGALQPYLAWVKLVDEQREETLETNQVNLPTNVPMDVEYMLARDRVVQWQRERDAAEAEATRRTPPILVTPPNTPIVRPFLTTQDIHECASDADTVDIATVPKSCFTETVVR